ncbi:MAG: hypothetical protein IPK68_23575 [Bdellovibrionales bacterium]|nr:hypothetical protein [Bdellovibrionales bacterium]
MSQLDLCKYLVSELEFPYKLSNLFDEPTITKMGEKLLAEPDMDGIPDELEGQRGFDPTKAIDVDLPVVTRRILWWPQCLSVVELDSSRLWKPECLGFDTL